MKKIYPLLLCLGALLFVLLVWNAGKPSASGKNSPVPATVGKTEVQPSLQPQQTVGMPHMAEPAQQQSSAQPLFKLLEKPPALLVQSDERVRRSILSRVPVEVNRPALDQIKTSGSGLLVIETQKNGPITAKIGRIISNPGGGYSLSGHLVGFPMGSFMATVHEDAVLVNVRTGDEKAGDYEVVFNPQGGYELRNMDTTNMPVCDAVMKAPPPEAGDSSEPPVPQKESGGVQGTAEIGQDEPIMAADDGSVIDVMVVYTANARNARGGTSQIRAAINQAVNESNEAFSRSNVATAFRLAHAAEISYTESDSSTDLSRLRGKTDGYMDSVHSLRNTYAADIVSLWTDGNYAGIGYIMLSLSNSFESSAFNVCDIDYAVSNYTLAHECGHNMGCAHDRDNSDSGLYSYSFGYRWYGTSGSQYRSIMAYPPGTRVLRFSSPSVTYNGGTTGNSSNDNARTLSNVRNVVSNWRQAPTSSSLSLSPSSQSVAAAGGSHSFSVTAMGLWSWTKSATWVTTSEATSQSGNQTFSYSVAANSTSSSRTATITLTNGSISRSFTISQAGNTVDDHGNSTGSATLVSQNSTTNGSIESIGDHDYFRIVVSGNGTLEAKTTGTTDTYGTLFNSSGTELANSDDADTLNFLIRYTVSAGTYYVRVRHYGDNGTGSYQLVCSSTSAVTLSIDPTAVTVPAAGGNHSFEVFSNATWTWTDNAAWVTSSEATSQSGNQVFSFSTQANTGSSSRPATITLTSGSLTATHYITQEGTTTDDHGNSTSTATVVGQNSTTNGRIEASGDNDFFRINVTGPGTLVVGTTGTMDSYGHLLNSSGAELAYNDDSSGLNFGISYTVTAGTYYVRVRHYSSTSLGIYQFVSSFTTTSSLSLNPGSASLPAAGGSRSLDVSSSGIWTWSDNATWVTSNEATSQIGNQTFSYTVAANAGVGTRSATISFVSGGITVNHTITQTGTGADDHGNGMSTATLIGQDSGTQGRIETGGDYDYFRIVLAESGVLVVGTLGSTDTFGFLYNSSGSELARNDDSVGTNFRIVYAVSAGTYYVAVRHYNNTGTGAYEMTSSFAAGVHRDDHGNSTAAATPVTRVSTTNGSIEVGGDNDFFRITLTTGGDLTIKTTGTTDTYGHLLDSNGTEIAFNDDSQARNFQIKRSLMAGTYYVRVRHFSTGGIGSYVFASSFVPTQRYTLGVGRAMPIAQLPTPDKAGIVTMVATPASSATALTRGGLQISNIKADALVRLTATAKAGHLFSHWNGLPAWAQISGHVASFLMPEADVRDVIATFVENPLPGLLGTRATIYQGLLFPNNAAPRNTNVGLLTATVTPATGAISGKILMDGKTTAFTGLLYGDGSVAFKVGSQYSPTFSFLGRELSAEWAEKTLSASVVGPTEDVSFGVATAAKAAPLELLDAKGKQGYYTLAMPSKTQPSGRAATDFPQGSGYSTMTLAANGSLKVAGLLADGTKITASTFLAEGNQSPLFIQLPTPGGKTKDGSFLGTLIFDRSRPSTDVSGTSFQWFRPAVTQTSNAATRIYSNGWPDGITLDPIGTLYDGAQTLQNTLALGAPGYWGNALLSFDRGEFVVSKSVPFTVEGNKVTKLSPNYIYALTMASKTGLFKGNVLPNWSNPASALPVFQGVLLQKAGNNTGFGYLLSNGIGTPPQSCRVRVHAP